MVAGDAEHALSCYESALAAVGLHAAVWWLEPELTRRIRAAWLDSVALLANVSKS